MVLMGKKYWKPLLDFLRERLLAQKTVDTSDIDRILVTDSAEHAVLVWSSAMPRAIVVRLRPAISATQRIPP